METRESVIDVFSRYQVSQPARAKRRPHKHQLLIHGLNGILQVQGYPFSLLQLVELRLERTALVEMLAGRQPLPQGLIFRRADWGGHLMLTNGHIHLTVEAPRDEVALVPPFGKVRRCDWHHLISLLDGRTIDEVLVAKAPPSQPNGHHPHLPSMSEEEKQAAALAKSGCFCPEEVEVLVISSNGRFMFRLGETNELWLVDKIGVGALYIFVEEHEARNWLTGQVTYHTARRVGHCIIHADGWESRAAAAIADYLGRG